MLDLVHLGESGFTHFLQCADFSSVDLSCKVDGPITTLTDLCDDSELVDTELGSSFTQGCTFSTRVALEFVCESRPCHLRIVRPTSQYLPGYTTHLSLSCISLEELETLLSGSNVAEQVN